MKQKLIDKYLPEYRFSEYHDITVNNGSVEAVYEVARDLDLSKEWIVPALFKLRGLPTQKLNALGFIEAMGFSHIEERYPFEKLLGYSSKDDKIISFSNYDDFINNTVDADLQVAFSFYYEKINTTQVKVSTETRVRCVSEKANISYPFYWYAIRFFSGLIRKKILKMIKQESEYLEKKNTPSDDYGHN